MPTCSALLSRPGSSIPACGRAPGLAAEVMAVIRTQITAAAVAWFDETTLRSRPAGEKKYVHGAFTELYSAFWLGARSLDSMEDAGIPRASPGS